MDDQENDQQLMEQLHLIKNFHDGNSHRCKRESLETLKKLYKYSRKTSLTRQTIIEIEAAIEKLRSQCDRNFSHTDDSCTEFYDLTDGTSKTSATKIRGRKRHTDDWRDQRPSRRSRDDSPKETNLNRRLQNVISTVRSWKEYSEKRESFARYSPTNSEDEDHRHHRRQRRSGSPSKYDRSHSRSPLRALKYDKKRRDEIRASPDRYRRSYSNDESDVCTERRSRSKSRKSDRYRRSRSQEKQRKRCRLSKSRSPSKHRRVPIPTYFKEEDVKPQPMEERNENGSTISSMDLESAPENHLNESVIDALRKKIQSTLARSNRNKSPARSSVNSIRHYALNGCQGEFDLDGKSTSESPVNQTDGKTYNTAVQRENISANLQVLKNDTKKLELDVQRKKNQFTFSQSMKADTSKVSKVFDEPISGTLTDARSRLSTLLTSALVHRSDNEEPGESPESSSTQEHRSIDNDSIDQEIIQKIVSRTQTSYQVAANVPMDFESVKQALATSKMLEKSRRYAEKPLIKNSSTSSTQLVRNNHSRLQFSHWAYSPTHTPSYTGTPVVNNTATQVIRSNKSNFLTTRVNLPIPSTKFLPTPALSMQKPVLPRCVGNQLKPKRLDDSSAKNSRRSSIFHVKKNDRPITHSEYKGPIASRGLLGKFKIPKKTTTTATVFNTPAVKLDFPESAEPAIIIESDSDNYDRWTSPSTEKENEIASNATANTNRQMTPSKEITKVQRDKYLKRKKNDNASNPATNTYRPKTRFNESTKIQRDGNSKQKKKDAASNSTINTYRPMTKSNKIAKLQRNRDSKQNEIDTPSNPATDTSKEENPMTALKEWVNTNQFATLVDLMQQLSQNQNLEKLKEALKNTNECVTNKELAASSNTATSTSCISVSAVTTVAESNGKRSYRKKTHNTLTQSSHSHGTNGIRTVVDRTAVKNIQLDWHSLRKVLNCQVCDKPHGNSLISHYINEHPNSEVLTSRLAPEGMESLRAGVDECTGVIVKYADVRHFHYKQFCYFCNVYKCCLRSAWITHLSRHTGYYRYKCKDCSRLFASKPQGGRCAKLNQYDEIDQPQFDKREILAYICELCNYVRCHKHEIEMHLSKEHDETDLTKFKTVTFLRFPDIQGRYQREKKGIKTADDFLASSTASESEYKTESDSEYETNSDTDDSLSQCESDWTNVDPQDEIMSENDST